MFVRALKSYPLVSLLLMRDFNKGVIEIMGKQVDCGVGYGLKITGQSNTLKTIRDGVDFESACWSQIYTGRLKELTDTTCGYFSVHIIECNLYCNDILGQ